MSLLLLKQLDENKEKLLRDKECIIDWLTGDADDFTHEVTFTYPNPPRDRWHSERILGAYYRWLIDRCFGKGMEGRIKMVALLEGEQTGKALHYHCALRCPSHMSHGRFSYRIVSTWQDCVKNDSARVCVNRYTNNGWLSYASKEITRKNNDVISEHINFG